MAILEEVSRQLRDSMRAQDALRTAALRSIRASFLHEMKKDGAETLPNAVCVALLRRLEKQRRESIEAFEQAGRAERADAERGELAVIQEFLPRLADEAQTRAWVQAAIESSGATGPGDLGRVMGALMKLHRGEVDGTLARRLAHELLGE